MVKHRKRGPQPDPNSAWRRSMARREQGRAMMQALAERFPTIETLPPLLILSEVERHVPASIVDPLHRRNIAAQFLRRLGCLALGSHRRGDKCFTVWASRDFDRARAMSPEDRTLALLGPPEPAPLDQWPRNDQEMAVEERLLDEYEALWAEPTNAERRKAAKRAARAARKAATDKPIGECHAP